MSFLEIKFLRDSENLIVFHCQVHIMPKILQNIFKQRKLKNCIWSICLAKRRVMDIDWLALQASAPLG